MARREFNLPGIQDLSKEQEDARVLPKQGRHLIIGGPGTGKSVLALLRSRRHQHDKDPYVFLVYNKLLQQASRQLFGTELCSKQWQAWFINIFREMTNDALPKLDPDKYKWKEIDWGKTLEIIADLASNHGDVKRPFLIIDEGQDMPPEFYLAILNLGFEDLYVVADQNQKLEYGRHSNRDEIRCSLSIKLDDVIELKYNYRNTHPIARLAREFYTGDPASPPPAFPNKPSAFRPMLVEYKPDYFPKIINRILKMADNDPTKLIGVIAPNNVVRERYYDELNKNMINVKFDNGPPRVVSFKKDDNHEPLFIEGGIMVINAKACKGLEFDTVFLADINEYNFWLQIRDEIKCLFYVMVARAKEKVIMLKEAGKPCLVDAILPQDNEILERK